MNIHVLKLFSSSHHADVTQVTTSTLEKNFHNSSSAVAICDSSAMRVGASLLCVCACAHTHTRACVLAFILCSLIKCPVEATCFSRGPRGSSKSICMHLHHFIQLSSTCCLVSFCLYVIALSSICVFLCFAANGGSSLRKLSN